MTEWGLRVRTFASDYFNYLLVAALLVAAIGGVLVYTTHVDPGVERQQDVTGTWESTGSYDHSATVRESNPVFPVGSTLEGRSTYYTRLSPELDGTFRYRFDADVGELDVDVTSRLIVRSVGEDGEVLWRLTERLGNDSVTLSPGDPATVRFTVNVSEVATTIEEVESDLGTSPGETEVFVRTDVSAAGTAAGGNAEHEATYDLAISPDGDTYGVTSENGVDEHRHVETVTRQMTYGPLRSLLGPVLVLAGLSAIAVLAVARFRSYLPVSETERTAARHSEERREFDDWISRGRVPPEVLERPAVEISSLEDLVDVAVDTEGRVIEDPDANCYYVLTEAESYRYEPPDDVPL